MTFPGVADADARADLVAFLAEATAPGGAERLVEKGVIKRTNDPGRRSFRLTLLRMTSMGLRQRSGDNMPLLGGCDERL